MENSLNSTSPEPTVQGLKSIFNKPGNFYQAFEVSMNESTTVTRSNKSEVDLDSTSAPGKALPFKRKRKSLQQPFNVNPDESVNSECEQSVTFVKPQSVFSKKNKSIDDFFNVSYNETIESSQADGFSKSIDESNIVSKEKNPFKKTNESQNEISISNESSAKNSSKVNNKSHMEESQKTSECSLDGDEADSTTFLIKQNPFKKSMKQKNDSQSQLNISITDENRSVGNQSPQIEINTSTKRVSDEDEDSDSDSTIMKSKLNPFKQAAEQNSDTQISLTKARNIDTSKENELTDTREASKSLGLEPSILKLNNNTSYLEQSSINDDNLNNWMSDQSDDEMPPPRVPSLTGNLSHTKEKQTASSLPTTPSSAAAPSSPVAPSSPIVPSSPTAPSTPAAEPNPLSIWEQKFNEIVSNAEKKTKKPNLKVSCSNSPKKPNPFKKFDANVGKPPVEQNKYKPQKLIKPAPFATKKLYNHIIKKLEPKYGIDTIIESENLVSSICETVKMVTRRKGHQKRLIQQLKKEMAEAGVIETTMDFFEFVIKFLPYNFRVKVVPCVQPVTNVVYPPKDVQNPFDKIL